MTINKLTIVPIFQREANVFVSKYHRHHKPVVGSIFQIAVHMNSQLVGVAICGRPVTSSIDFKKTIEINRVCVINEIPNACSKLYGCCARIARELGYEKIITYTLATESGISLKASGWHIESNNAGGKSWTTKNRTRNSVDLFGNKKYSEEKKIRWAKSLNQK